MLVRGVQRRELRGVLGANAIGGAALGACEGDALGDTLGASVDGKALGAADG